MDSRVVRTGDRVRRPLEQWSQSVHALLGHLEAARFPAPRVVGVEGRTEILTWIEGESGSAGWAKVVPERGLRSWGRFLREYHEVVSGYRPPADSVWSSGRGSCAEGEIVCHGDFGPWNAVWRGDDVVGLIDWDHARPAPPLFDVAYGLEYVAPFRDDEESVREMGYARPPDRRRRIEVFCEAYGIEVPRDVVTQVARQQELTADTVASLARAGIEPQATWVREGYLEELARRRRFTESIDLG